MPRPLVLSTSVLLLFVCVAVARAEDGFRPLFNGEDLSGWVGDGRLWSVEDGMIVGSTDEHQIQRNSFLSTAKAYDNFVLRLKFKLRNGNSGVQIRSKQHDNHVVTGYQADIADNRYMGILYEEGGRGILQDVNPTEVQPHVNEGDWNEYVITVDGPRIQQELNGHTTVDYTETSDEAPTSGVIALQLHVGPKMRIWFKDIELKPLP